MRGTYIIEIPTVFTRRDMKRPDWFNLKRQLITNVFYCLEEQFEHLETVIRNKKRNPYTLRNRAARHHRE